MPVFHLRDGNLNLHDVEAPTSKQAQRLLEERLHAQRRHPAGDVSYNIYPIIDLADLAGDEDEEVVTGEEQSAEGALATGEDKTAKKAAKGE